MGNSPTYPPYQDKSLWRGEQFSHIFYDEADSNESIEQLEAALKRIETERKVLIEKIKAWEIKNAKIWIKKD